MFAKRYSSRRANRRNNRGTSLMEVLVGAMFFIPIVLLFMDIGSLTMIQQLNDHLAKDAARAAANQLDETHAKDAAQKAAKMFPLSSLVTNVQVTCTYQNGSVSTVSTMDANVPAPIWGLNGRKLVASSYQPIVGTPANL